MVSKEFDPTLEVRRSEAVRTNVVDIGRGYDAGFAAGWGKAKGTIQDLNQKAGDDKAFRLMVLAAFLPNEQIPEPQIRDGSLRVWWVQNPPDETEYHYVKSIEEAIAKLNELSQRDLALGDAVVSNAGGLQEFGDRQWHEYYDKNGDGIWQIMEEN